MITNQTFNFKLNPCVLSAEETKREQQLIEQLLVLTEERNALFVPQAGTSIPGSSVDWNPPPGLEPHVPVVLLASGEF